MVTSARRPRCSSRLAASCFLNNLALLRLKQAWRAALQLDERRYWLALSNKVQNCRMVDVWD